jgi:hypothetical protein
VHRSGKNIYAQIIDDVNGVTLAAASSMEDGFAAKGGNIVMQRTGVAQRHADELSLGLLGRLANRLGHLAGLAVTKADAAFLVTDDDQCGKAEPAPALDHLGHAVDVDQAVDELAVALFAPAAVVCVSHLIFLPLA